MRTFEIKPLVANARFRQSDQAVHHTAAGDAFALTFDRHAPQVTLQSRAGEPIRMSAVGSYAGAELRDGLIAYRASDGRSAMVYRPAAYGVKEDLLLLDRSAFGDGVFVWSLETPPDVEARHLADGSIGLYAAEDPFGAVNICDRTSTALMTRARAEKTRLIARIPAPVAHDAGHRELRARFDLRPPLLAVTVELRGTSAFPISVDPTVVITTTGEFETNGNNEGLVRTATDQAHRDDVLGFHVPSWLSAGSFTTARHSHGSAVYKGRLYIVGGRAGTTYYDDVQFATINSDGTVGTFSSTTAVPGGGRAGHGLLIYNGYIYVLGGEDSTAATLADVRYAKLNDDGTISAAAWLSGPTILSGGRKFFVAGAYNNYFYIAAGASPSGAVTDVVYSAVRADGSLAGWSTTSSTTGFHTNGASFVHDGHIYAIGGKNASSLDVATAEFARIGTDGTLSAWETTTPLPSARSAIRGVAAGGYAFTLGGSGASNSARSAPILPGGGLGPWTETTTLSPARADPAAVAHNGRLLVSGGASAGTPTSTVISGMPRTGDLSPQPSWDGFNNDLPSPRGGHSTATYNDFLYVIGGTANFSTDVIADVLYSAIDAAGSHGAWTTTTALPAGRFYHASVAHNGYLYVIGGRDASSSISEVRYAAIGASGTVGAWTLTSALPAGRIGHTAVVYNGYIYVAGGREGTGITPPYTDTVLRALIASDGTLGAWSAVTSMPGPRHLHSSVAYAGRLYVIAGEDSVGGILDVRFAPILSDGTLGSWSAAVSFPEATSKSLATAASGHLYVCALGAGKKVYVAPINADGTIGTFVATSDQRFNIADRAGLSLHNGFLYVTGGSGRTTERARTFHGAVKPWTATSAFTTARSAHGAVAHGGYLYVLGGVSGSQLSDVRYAPISTDGSVGTWTATTSLSPARGNHATVVHAGRVYVIGGGTSGAALGSVHYAAFNSDGTLPASWTSATTLNTARYSASAAVYGGRIYLAGGYDGSGAALDTVEYATINGDGSLTAWAFTSALPTARAELAVVAHNGYLYAIGGTGAAEISEVAVAPITGGGTLGTWSRTTDLPTVRRGLSGTVVNGFIYITGGRRGSTYFRDTYYGPIDSTGAIGTWTPSNAFATARAAHALTAHNGVLYALGGDAGGTDSAEVRYAGVLAPNPRAVYSRLVDLGSDTSVTSITTAGGGSNGRAKLEYRLATDAAPTWGAVTTVDPLSFGTAVSVGATARYVHLRYTLEDGGAATLNPDATAHLAIDDITVTVGSTVDPPGSPNQYQSGGATVIAVGAGASTTTVVFKAILSDPNPGDTVRLHVEVRAVGTPFTGVATSTSGFVASGTEASVTAVFTAGAMQHWQCWAEDIGGALSSVVVFGGNPETSADHFIDQAPGVPGTMGQFDSDGATVIPDGGTAASNSVVLKADRADPDSLSTVKIQLELRPTGTPFTSPAVPAIDGVTFFETALGVPPAQGSISVSGLAAGGYHWQMRCVDDTGLTSAWTPFSGAATNFTVTSANSPPDAPASLAQFQSDGTTSIAIGGAATTSTVRARGSLSDPNSGDTVKMQVELRPIGTAFTSPASPTIDGVVFFESALGAPGTVDVTLTVPGDDSYHWQARTVDGSGAASAWTPFGGNSDTVPAATDFYLDLVNDPPTISGATVGQFQSDGATVLVVGGSATNVGVVFKATPVDPNGNTVKLQVELRDTLTGFTPAFTHESGFVASGTVISISSGSLADGSYHWAYRAVDSVGAASAWTSFGGNPDLPLPAAADFTVAPSAGPSVPGSPAQFDSGGVTTLPLGFSTTPGTVVLQGIVSSPAALSCKLQVEVRPVGTAFTGVWTAESAFVASGSTVQVTVPGLGDGAYHWQARTLDALGVGSSAVSFGGNPEADPDFRIDTTNDPPSPPFSLGQYVPPGTVGLAVGGPPVGRTVFLRGMILDGEIGQVAMQVELRPVGTPFSGAATHISSFGPPGVFSTVTVNGLAGGAYHWQARAVDNLGQTSAWVSYGMNSESTPDFFIDATTAVPPNQPLNLQQKTANDLAIVATGSIIAESAIRLKALVVHPRTELVKLEVEVKPTAVDFTGVPDGESSFVDSGTTTSVFVFGLANDSYHWQARTVDVKGTTSPWASYGGNAEIDPDFIVSVLANTPANEPAFLGQLRADGVTLLPLGATTTQSAFQIYTFLSDPDGDPTRLEVEIKPLGVAFDGALSAQSDFYSSGATVQLTVGSVQDGRHHWRVRARDANGGASAWVAFGGNPETAPDFIVNSTSNTAPPAPTAPDQLRDGGSISIPVGGLAGAGEITFRSPATDAEMDLVRLEVEVRPAGDPLTLIPTHCGRLGPAGFTADAIAEGFAIGTGYHWQARVVDVNGAGSGWVEFGGNPSGDADFVASFSIAGAGGGGGSCGSMGIEFLLPLGLLWLWRRRGRRL